jgi:hypothetical protein
VGVVERFDSFEDRLGQFGPGLPAAAVEEFELEGPEERFGHGIVQGVADGAHRSEQPRRPEPLAERPRGVLLPWSA